MVCQDFLSLAWVAQFHAPNSFSHPIEEELRRSLADAHLCGTDFDIKGGRRGEAKRLWIVGNDAHQEPAALMEPQFAKPATLLQLLDGHFALNPPILDDL